MTQSTKDNLITATAAGLCLAIIVWGSLSIMHYDRAARVELYQQRYAVWSKLNPASPLTYSEWVIAYQGDLLPVQR